MAYTNLLGQVRVGIRGRQTTTSQSLLLDGVTGLIGAYSLRKLIGTWTGGAILVRRSLDNSESVIGFDAVGDLDQSALTSFVRPTITGYVLDQYSGSSVGLSLRKISGSYSGSAIRVRRSGDNAEQNIGFSGDNLDTTSLLSFVGSGNGFVTTWYDQSGLGRNATQITAGSQPQIVSNGSILLQGGKPSIKYDGVDDYMTISTFTASVKTIFSIFQQNIVNSYDGVITARPTGETSLGSASDERSGFTFNNSSTVIDSFNSTSFFINTSQTNTTESLNGLNYAQYIKTNSLGGVKNFVIGSDIMGGGRWFDGSINEIIIYPTDQTSNRGSFIGNANTYYSWGIFMNNGYVKTWYDQSGLGKHATQVTNANQPMIFSNNSLLTSDSKSIMKYDGTNDFLVIPTFSDKVQTIFALFKKDITNFANYDGIITARDASSAISANSNERVGFTGIPGNSNITGFENTTGVWINGRVRDISNYKVYTSGQSLPYPTGLNLVTQFATASLIGTKNIIIGADTLGARYLNGSVREIILYSSNESSNRDTIETGINSYYNVYPNIVKSGLILNFDGNDRTSYAASGTTWFDISGYGNNGTLTNGVGYSSTNGGVMTFDGVNDFVNCGNSSTFNQTNALTLSTWVKINSFASTNTLIGKQWCYGNQYSYSLAIDTQGKLQFYYSLDGGYCGGTFASYISSNPISTNTWYNIVLSFTNTSVKLYLNGQLISGIQTGINTSLYVSNSPVLLGIYRNLSGTYSDALNGSMGSVKIYNRSLSDSEILQNFNALRSRFGL